MKIDAYTKALLGAAVRHAKKETAKGKRSKLMQAARKKRKTQKESRRANR